MTAYLETSPPPFAAVGSQAKFLLTGDGNLGVDHLYQYESMSKLVAFLESRLGQKLTLNQRNVSPKMTTELSPAIAARLKAERPDEFNVWDMGQR